MNAARYVCSQYNNTLSVTHLAVKEIGKNNADLRPSNILVEHLASNSEWARCVNLHRTLSIVHIDVETQKCSHKTLVADSITIDARQIHVKDIATAKSAQQHPSASQPTTITASVDECN